MRSIPLQIASASILLLLAILLLFSISACSKSDVDFSENPHSYKPITLENRTVYVSANIKSESWKIDDSNAITLRFIPESYSLFKLDSSLSRIAEGTELQCVATIDTCAFANSDYTSPYIELILSGHWIVDYTRILDSHNRYTIKSDTTEGTLTDYADIGKNLVSVVDWSSVQSAPNILQYVKDEGYPFSAAQKKAENALASSHTSNYQGESSLFVAEAIIQGYNPTDVLHFLSSLLYSSQESNFNDSTIEFAKTATGLIDSIVLKYGFDCNRFRILCGAYDLEQCSKDHYLDTVTNEFSIFNNSILACNKNVWNIIDSQEDSLRVCTNYNSGDTIATDSLNYKICTEDGWLPIDKSNLNLIFGTCEKNETKVIPFAGKYYFCVEKKWYDATKIDYEIGVCGRDIPYETAFIYNDTIALCRLSESAYSETANGITLTRDEEYSGHTWHWANETEAYLYRAGGNCDKKSDSMQIVEYKNITYGCVSTPQGLYGWRNLKAWNVKETIYVDKTDSTEQTIYGIKHGDFIFIQGSRDDTTSANLIGIYDIDDHHRYSIITTSNRQWLDAPLPSKCPEGFHVPSPNEVSAFISEVKNGNVPDMQYDPEKPFFRTSQNLLENAGLCIIVPTNGSIVNAQTFACKLDVDIPVACTREFIQ